jgi:site-specific DNA-cytosine methylase
MKVLELFAGSRSFSKVAEKHSIETYSTDIEDFGNINQVCNIFDFDYKQFNPDIIWASPPCEKWSLACGVEGGNIYWESVRENGKIVGIKPRENFDVRARYSILNNPEKVKIQRELHVDILEKTLEIISHYNPRYYFIENPFGYMKYYLEGRVDYINLCTYCQYGFPYRKPTNIFSNIKLDLKTCKIGQGCHSNNLYTRGKQNKISEKSIVNNYYDRSKVPEELCEEIIRRINER